MKLLSRDFTKKEKILILIGCIVLVLLLYYKFVDQTVRETITAAEETRENLDIEIQLKETELIRLQAMQAELEATETSSSLLSGYMPSYNAVKTELAFLNDLLADTETYNLALRDVTKSGDQIRREAAIEFTVADPAQADRIFTDLANFENRILVTDMQMTSADGDLSKGEVSVIMDVTFYETMDGGKSDAGLPEEVETEVEDEELDIVNW